jgi:heptosyltransferase-2
VAEVLELPFAHGGLQWAARRALARQLRGRFDTAYVCPNSLKSALLPWWAGVPLRVGYHGEGRWLLLNRRMANPHAAVRPPMVAFYSGLSGESELSADRPVLRLDDAEIARALAKLGLQSGHYDVLAPGAEFGPAKRWPASHFAKLAQLLPRPAVLLGSAKESELCAEITREANAGTPNRCIDLSGRTTLDQALAVIAGAHALVSNDSGLMHVAAAFGVPQVAIFGSSSPLHTPPLSDKAQVIWLKTDPAYQPALDCSPCFERTCPLGHTRCLTDIEPARVLRSL